MDERTTNYLTLAGAFAVLLWVLYGAFGGIVAQYPYAVLCISSFAVLVASAVYVHKLRENIDEMHGMMAGMTFGMVAGLVAGTLAVLPTGDFLVGLIVGSTAGLLFGVPFGILGGHLGLMEGIASGPMGGMMGAMLGQMIRPYDLAVFLPFFMILFSITMFGLTYSMNRGACLCEDPSGEKKSSKPSGTFLMSWMAAIALLLGVSLFFHFSIDAGQNSLTSPYSQQANPSSVQAASNSALPSYLKALTIEVPATAKVNGNVQEISLTISGGRYSPNLITVKKGIPLKITVTAAANAGCAREILFPDFGIDKVVPPGSTALIEFTPGNEGTFAFRCPMNMARGKLVVVA